MDDIVEYAKRATAAAIRRKMKLQAGAQDILRGNAVNDVNKWLHENYLLLRRGNELPEENSNLSVENIRTFMQNALNEHGGIPVTFLYALLHSEINQGSVRAVMQKKGAIFPEDKRWELYHQSI
jgi:hypothetical protein